MHSSPVHRITQLPSWKKRLSPEWRQAKAKLTGNPGDRLETAWDVAVALEMGQTLDANRATADQWLRLPGISIRQAQILSDLTQSGMQFNALEDVVAALGITEASLVIAAPLIRFYYYDPNSVSTVKLVNVNHADIQTLQQVPEMTAEMAAKIVGDRESRGKYRSLANLQRRINLPGSQLENWIHYLRV
ncbi:MAG: helix-hairpin-helix domain-containing protein [Cyanobacteria bacterium P01_D01_bin.73]